MFLLGYCWHGLATRCSYKMQLQDAATRCSYKMQLQDAATRCSYKMQLQDAATRCTKKQKSLKKQGKKDKIIMASMPKRGCGLDLTINATRFLT
jgi:hypothetical protein